MSRESAALPEGDLGSWLRLLREHAGLSQTELANAVGTDRRNIRRWESEGHDPGGSMLLRVLSALGVTIQPAPPEAAAGSVNAELRGVRQSLGDAEERAARRHDELLARLETQEAELRVLATRAGTTRSRPE